MAKKKNREKLDNLDNAPSRRPDPNAAGQSGDDQGLSHLSDADSESVDELNDEGQSIEADAIEGVEDAPDADVDEVRTREVPEDDVPEEYRDSEK